GQTAARLAGDRDPRGPPTAAGPHHRPQLHRTAGAQVRAAGGGLARRTRGRIGPRAPPVRCEQPNGPAVITELRISGLGVIADATLELHPGLTAVTGETGAGKTMVVTGLGLLLGHRADPGAVRTGVDRARVEGHVTLPPGLLGRAEEVGATPEDGELLVARQVSAQGRSRCWLAGTQVPIATCGDLVGEVITIHGQSEQLRLASADHQRDLLDRAGGEPVAQLLADYTEQWQRLRTVSDELARLTESGRERAREADMLQHALT